MTNTATHILQPTNPANYCGASHHGTITSTQDMASVRFRTLPTGARAHGPLYAFQVGALRGHRLPSTAVGCVVVRRDPRAVAVMLMAMRRADARNPFTN